MHLMEKNTWGSAYPILTTTLHRLIGGYQSPSIDGYLKYLAQCSGIGVSVPGVLVWRQHVQSSASFKTPLHEANNKESLFRESENMKKNLLSDCLTVLTHEGYVTLNQAALSNLQSDWFEDIYIGDGPTGLR